MAATVILIVTGVLLCCIRMASLVDQHDGILQDSENEKY
jgi:hypothetical protein